MKVRTSAAVVTIAVIAGLSFTANSADRGGKVEKVKPTYLDTLNYGKELRLTQKDFPQPTVPTTPPPAVTATSQQTPAATSQAAPAPGKAAEIDGYRIQCFASTNIEALRAEKKKIENRFRYPAYITAEQALYRLQLGDFLRRVDAEAALTEVRGAGIKDAWIVRAKVAAGR